MRIHYIQHVVYEDLGCINDWVNKRKHKISSTKIFENETFPNIETFDLLIILGGPMSVNDNTKWIKKEKLFIAKAIENNKKVLGICLGSQFIASILGSKVFQNSKKEIGWFPIQITKYEEFENPIEKFNSKITVFHWHGETFNLPKNSFHLAKSEIYQNQAFMYNRNVIALQFHLEVTEKSLEKMITFGKNELINDDFIQSIENMRSFKNNIIECNKRMFLLLEYFEKN
ncbi:type 1 glutamine amidotransferase [Flavobacterium luminosum]|uniref:Type 1 glutamine amidotransferase n=1 Tax=Flavobacterium luminosum TaxID=2949086 RepID=A0ABT0TRS4_9FLAO|nr:type 1 glutamine amidotransferase [Flavobacterium sp. HXWNR70]MCL9809986.1 type 1 glutamine amidotransferase [Flavobacterium sp. HXWNR70]